MSSEQVAIIANKFELKARGVGEWTRTTDLSPFTGERSTN
jgi:hypothetical protein